VAVERAAPDLAQLGERVQIRQAFVTRRRELEIDRLCSCDGCVQASQLTLKFVSHVGDVAFQKVKRMTELAGVDVIFVHRSASATWRPPRATTPSRTADEAAHEPA
jgi:Protein of unknown function (DUF2652)